MGSRILFVGDRGGWILPDGLDRCRPRQVSLTSAGKGVVVLAGLLLAGALAGGIGLGIVATRQAEESRLLHQESMVTEGRITRLWRSGDKNRQRWISYRFAVGGQMYQGSTRVSAETWGRLRIGFPIPVHCVPSRPELNYPLNAAGTPMPLWVPPAVAFGLTACSLPAVLQIRSQARLLSEGRAAPGQVTKLSKAQRGSHGSDLGQKVYYRFSLLSGAVGSGHAGPIKKPPAVGSTITVLYDPEMPRRNAPYPLALVAPSNRRPLR